MKRVNLNYFIALLLIISLVACKSKTDIVTKDVKPLKTEVAGYLSGYLQIVDGTYQATKDKSLVPSWVVKVKVKAIKPYATTTDEGLKDGDNGPLKLDLFDDKGTPLAELDNLQSSFQDDSKLLDILTKGTGETWVTFSKFNYSQGLQQLPDNTSSFSINSEKKEAKLTSSTSVTSTTDDNSSSTSDNQDWDKILDDYESYVDQYISFWKKAQAGDDAAMAEYPAMMEKTIQFEASLTKAKKNNSLTPDQGIRMMKIQNKMLTIMQKK